MNITDVLDTGHNELYDEMIKENIENRILVLNDNVTDSVIEDYILYILKWNKEDKDIPIEKRKVITLYINSCGGDAFAGLHFAEICAISKTPIRSIAMSLVASAAFYIYIACSERIAFKNSVLLMHDGSIEISNSSRKASDTMKFIELMEQRTKEFVLSHTTMDEKFYDDHFDQEFYMYAERGKELGAIDRIIGVDENIDINYIL